MNVSRKLLFAAALALFGTGEVVADDFSPTVLQCNRPRTGVDNFSPSVVISIRGGGAVFWNSQRVSQQRLVQLIIAAKRRNSPSRYLIKSTPDTPYAKMLPVMVALNSNGAEGIDFSLTEARYPVTPKLPKFQIAPLQRQ